MPHALVFPGQGSQSVGMLADLAATHPVVKQTFEHASDALSLDLWALSQSGPEEQLNQTDNTQPALLAAGIAVARVWEEQGGNKPTICAGHSLGEYTALTYTDALKFEDAIRLVAERGRLMQAAVPAGVGAMAAVLGLDDAAVKQACADAAQEQVVSAVNFNAPGQVVVAGHKEAVERATALAKEAGARKAVLLPVSVPSHCALMKSAAKKLAETLAATDLHLPNIPVLHNADVTVQTEVDAIRQALAAQLHRPVRWVESIEKIASEGVTQVIECGPGKVLTGLHKRINKSLQSLPCFDNASLEKALQAVQG